MAEFVQLRKEQWTDPLRFLQKLNLFDKSELSSVVAKLESFEYKIQTPNRKLEDILRFIEFECKFLQLIQQRRQNADQFERTEEIDKFIFNEISSQFGSAEINFQHDLDYWNARFKFIATIVPNENREVEFNRIFRKALDYCGRTHFELYPSCVNFLWSFLPTFTFRIPLKKKVKLTKERRNVSRIMSTVREITKDALRNFPRSHEAYIWVLTTELSYAEKLCHEEELSEDEIQREIEKTEMLIRVLSKDFTFRFNKAEECFKLIEAVKTYNVPQSDMLFRSVYDHIMSIQPRTLEIYEWLIDKAIEDRNANKCMEMVIEALSSPLPKEKALRMCLKKLDAVLESVNTCENCDDFLLKVVGFYADLFDEDNPDKRHIMAEDFHISRIKFLKMIPKLQKLLTKSPSTTCDDTRQNTVMKVATINENHPLKTCVIESAKKFPTSFYIVKERILQLISSKGDNLKPAVICRYLKELNLPKLIRDSSVVEQNEIEKLLRLIYSTFVLSTKLSNQVKKLLKVPGTDSIRIIHMRRLYMESQNSGRLFYAEFRNLTTDWKLALTVVEIETNISRGDVTTELRHAIHDATRLAQTSSTEPWKTCVSSLQTLKKENEASALLQRALSLFSATKDESKHNDLLLFSKSYRT